MGACNSAHKKAEHHHNLPAHGGIKPIFFEHATLSEQGQSRLVTQRRPNQDRVCAHINFTKQSHRALFGVFDGHGQEGEHLAEFVMQRLPQELERELKNPKNRSMEEIAKVAFAKCAEDLREKHPVAMRSGTTATIVYLDGPDLWTFNVGDSRAVLAQRFEDGFRAFALSRDHSPDDPEERQRVQAAGARVEETRIPHLGSTGSYRVIMGPVTLAMTRAFGDFSCGDPIFPEPEVRCHTLVEGRDLVLILASDGVWTFMENHNVVERALEAETAQEACENICEQAVLLWEQDGRVDDISLCTVFFNGHTPLQKTSKSHIHPLQLVDERRKVIFDHQKAHEFRALVNQLRTAREVTTDPYQLACYNAKWPEIMELLDAFDEQLAQSEARAPLDACQEKLLPVRERSLRIPLTVSDHGAYGVLECLVYCEPHRKLSLACRVAIVSDSPTESAGQENVRFEILSGKFRGPLPVLRRIERAISKGQFQVNFGAVPVVNGALYNPKNNKYSRKQSEMNLDDSYLHGLNSLQVRFDDDKKEELIIPLMKDEEALNTARRMSVSASAEAPQSQMENDSEKVMDSGQEKDMALPPDLKRLLPASYKRNLSITNLDDLNEF